jgi:hypothetical protein
LSILLKIKRKKNTKQNKTSANTFATRLHCYSIVTETCLGLLHYIKHMRTHWINRTYILAVTLLYLWLVLNLSPATIWPLTTRNKKWKSSNYDIIIKIAKHFLCRQEAFFGVLVLCCPLLYYADEDLESSRHRIIFENGNGSTDERCHGSRPLNIYIGTFWFTYSSVNIVFTLLS